MGFFGPAAWLKLGGSVGCPAKLPFNCLCYPVVGGIYCGFNVVVIFSSEFPSPSSLLGSATAQGYVPVAYWLFFLQT